MYPLFYGFCFCSSVGEAAGDPTRRSVLARSHNCSALGVSPHQRTHSRFSLQTSPALLHSGSSLVERWLCSPGLGVLVDCEDLLLLTVLVPAGRNHMGSICGDGGSVIDCISVGREGSWK